MKDATTELRPTKHAIVQAIIPISQIVLPQSNVRRTWRNKARKNASTSGSEALNELTQSVRDWGILEPIIVRPLGQNQYELVAGRRRLVAAQRAGDDHIQATIRDMSEADTRIVQLIENVQRHEMDPLDVAQAYADMLDSGKAKNPSQIARLVGVSPNRVSAALRVLRDKTLAEGVRTGLIARSIAEGATSIPEPYDQIIRAKLQAGEKVDYKDLLDARTKMNDDDFINPNGVKSRPPQGWKSPNYQARVVLEEQPSLAQEIAAALDKSPVYAEVRADPVYAQVQRRIPPVEPAYTRDPVHVVVESPASRVERRLVRPTTLQDDLLAHLSGLDPQRVLGFLDFCAERGMELDSVRRHLKTLKARATI